MTVAPAAAALAVALCLSVACTVSAADPIAESSACRKLEYGTLGPSRSEYRPCVGEIMAALDELEPLSTAALNGDVEKRRVGRATLRRTIALMKAAGGLKLLDRWNDRALTDLNLDIHNAVTHYHAFYLLPIKKEPHRFAAKTRDAAAAELQGALRNQREARVGYRNIGGR